jgi:methylglutamate dehydrogenase subunit C
MSDTSRVGTVPVKPRRLAGNMGLIDRQRPLGFQFDGRPYSGFAGDTLASALLASGVKIFGRSFKYHRPRGVLTAGSEEPNALVELRSGSRREPNTRATTAELFDGLEAWSQNRWPSLAFDVRAINSLLSPIFVAGFYYKTFMWPKAFWEKIYEPLIRRAAGLGSASGEPDPDTYEKVHTFCDVLVIGAGPAGLSAALAAGRAGARVILTDEDFVLGGRLSADRREIDGMPGAEWARQVEAELATLPDVRVFRRTTVFGAYDGHTYGAIERVADHLIVPPPGQPRQRDWRIVAKHAILAAGSIERPIVFAGNDRPGVMFASAVRAYVNRFRVAPGARAVIFTATDEGWSTAFDLRAAGVSVEAVVDPRREVSPELLARAGRLGAPALLGARVIATHGARAIHHVSIEARNGRRSKWRADLLAVSGGFNPTLALSTHLGARPRWSEVSAAFVPAEDLKHLMVVGAAAGFFSLAEALRQGQAAGVKAAESLGFSAPPLKNARTDAEPLALKPFWFVPESTGKAFVDFQNDVTREDVELAAREGYSGVELAKRYTTLGMGTDQGKTSNLNGHAILAALSGRTISELGTITFRPPYTPVAIGALAGPHRGRQFRPTRLTSGHEWAKEQGATFVEAGQWLRTRWFAKPGEKHWLESVNREVMAVRLGVGICDISTLGKIDIQGPDAAVFLDRVYINSFSTLPVGKVRYGLMLREDGFVMDDGTSARLATSHYVMSTTTVNAAKVMQHLEHARQVRWPELDVQIASITEQWAQYSIAGPKARVLLQRLLGTAVDISNAAFPYLACAEFPWRSIHARLFRISFSGELAYELAVPARYGDATIRAIMDAGAEFGVTPYGTEALSVMRIEKGHAAGPELNGTTTAGDLGLGRLMSTKKDFIGRVLAARPALVDSGRQVLVGLKPCNLQVPLNAGAHLLSLGASLSLENSQGFITSAAYSPLCGHSLGLGLLSRGRERLGERIVTYDALRGCTAEEVQVVSPVFYDPQGLRLQS